MRKVLKTNHKREPGGLDILAALTLTMSLAVFGCTTNRNPGSSGTTVTPPTMVSSSPDAPSPADAIAILQANEAYRGKILGPADPGGPQRSEIALQATGQYVPPMANPQLAVNSSVSSTPVPAITSGGAGSVTASALTTSASSVVPTAVSAPSAATASITSATPTAGTTVPVTAPSTISAPAPATALTAAARNGSVTTAGSTMVTGTASAPIRIDRSSASTGVIVTNQRQSLGQRFLTLLGLRRAKTASTTTTTAPVVLPTQDNP